MASDWLRWHDAYEEPGSYLARRLTVVQGRIREALDAMPAGAIDIVGFCSGDGRDLLGVLAGHRRAGDVRARLVEQGPELAARGRAAAAAAGLSGVELVTGDAAELDTYDGAVPAALVLLCGVFDNITDDDIAATVAATPQLCAPGGRVIWTRHRKPPDLTPAIRGWFADAGCAELSFDAPDEFLFSVGVHRFDGEPQPLERGRHLFQFVV